MAENNSPAELGFAEFVAKLISEIFNALATAQFDQEKQLAELAEASAITLSEFGKRYITGEQLDEELEQLFPGTPPENSTSIYVGAPYRIRQKNSDELPPIQAVLGVVLGKGDYARKGELLILKQAGVDKVTAAVREKLADSQQSDIAQVLKRGIPRIIADAGKINAKLTYEVLSTEQAEKPERAKSLVAPVNSLVSAGYLSKSPALSKFHLLVRQADERAPQTSKLKVNVFGEVEITFKTIM